MTGPDVDFVPMSRRYVLPLSGGSKVCCSMGDIHTCKGRQEILLKFFMNSSNIVEGIN